jgi:HTH-type transcriptional regulator / antitoxin HipB
MHCVDKKLYIPVSDVLTFPLRVARRDLKLTQAELGEIVGLSEKRISELEANPGLMTVDQLLKLSAALKLAVYVGPKAELIQLTESEPGW